VELYRVYAGVASTPAGRAGHPLTVSPVQGAGRVDNPERYAVLYAADTQDGAVGERFGDLRTWSASMLMERPYLPGSRMMLATLQLDGVICDLDALGTLPARELRSGNGEMAKYHFLTGDDLTALDLEARVARCVEIKAAAVVADERESGSRALLNYGHTLAHALEIATHHEFTHGEAVAVGLVFAARLAAATGRIDEARAEEHRRVVVDEYGLDDRLPDGLDLDELVALMARDKKAIDGLTFVLDGPGGLGVVRGISPDAVRETLAGMRRR